jgi:hypothetical protein
MPLSSACDTMLISTAKAGQHPMMLASPAWTEIRVVPVRHLSSTPAPSQPPVDSTDLAASDQGSMEFSEVRLEKIIHIIKGAEQLQA